MNIILLGAPGAGKGTQAELLRQRLGIPAISTGNIIREAIHNQTEMGKQAKALVDEGKLVPDEVVIGIIRDRLAQEDCKKGYILDGFPRTIPQAEALEEMGILIDYVIEIQMADDKIVDRMVHRRVCPSCGATYHLLYDDLRPKQEGICDKCGAQVIQRKDDHPETVLERLKTYHEQTEPLKGFYAQRNLLHVVIGGKEDPQETCDEILQVLGETP